MDTHYEVVGSGPPLLVFSPGGFIARLDKWGELGSYREIAQHARFAGHLAYVQQEGLEAVVALARGSDPLLDRDTVPGAEPEGPDAA